MAIVTKFTCISDENDYVAIDSCDKEVIISTYYNKDGQINYFYLDIQTAIKLSKTIRTEINKIKS